MENRSENECQTVSILSHKSSSDDEVVLQNPQFKPSTSQMQAMQQMYMPNIEGPKMDWTVNDSLYNGSKMENQMWKHIALWTGNAIRSQKV